MRGYGEADFEELEGELEFCLQNIAHPQCTLAEAGRFYEEATEALRAHAILRLLIDADGDGFRNDLVMSGHARRAYLRRCQRERYVDYFIALSRSGAALDAIAAGAGDLANEIFALSPPDWRPGDEYEDDYWYQRFLGALLPGTPADRRELALDRFTAAAKDGSARVALCRALQRRNSTDFDAAFTGLLQERREEIAADAPRAEEEVAVALETKVFVEGVALVRLARRAGLETALEYPMCPALALTDGPLPEPKDEFAVP